MMTFLYKEPIELLIETLKNIQTLNNSDKVALVIGIEERTPDKEMKIERIETMFKAYFEKLVIC
jgi:hypothetical protein